MEPEDGVIRVYGLGDDSVVAFTASGASTLNWSSAAGAGNALLLIDQVT